MCWIFSKIIRDYNELFFDLMSKQAAPGGNLIRQKSFTK
jgi:hypothetical protein